MEKGEEKRQQLGEIIAASYGSFTAESYELNSVPPLGALVIAQNVVGVVADATTEGLGPISARGSAEDEDGDVYNIYPELRRTLRSQFTALVAGYYLGESGTALYAYPDCPPKVHFKCWLASEWELVEFTSHPDYLLLLLGSTEAAVVNIDQVVIHLIVGTYRARNNDREWLSSTAEYLGRQLKDQYDRLLAILKTIDALTRQPNTMPNQGIHEAVGKVKL